jgi:hypothetical protein
MRTTVLSWGLGADSTAILLMILDDPQSFGLLPDLSDFVVIHAVTGNEFPDTLDYVNRLVLGKLRDKNVRLVQVCRGGHLESAGALVLEDTRQPYAIHQRGPWVLSEDLREAGTVPTLAKGLRTCSIKAKGWVLDRWAHFEFGGAPYRRIIGYNADEMLRAEKDSAIERRRNTEAGRVICDPYYPLIERRLGRAAVESYVEARLGEPIRKSACVMCCFAGVCASRPEHEERLRLFPHLAADALRLEYTAMALNENSSLFGTTSLYQRLTEDDRNRGVLTAFEESLDQAEWAVYDVRRIYHARRTEACRAWHGQVCRTPRWWCRHDRTQRCLAEHGDRRMIPLCGGGGACAEPARKGPAWRSVRTVARGDDLACQMAVRRFARQAGGRLERGALSMIQRAHYLTADDGFPAAHGFLVAAPVGAKDKERPGFARAWARRTGDNGQHIRLPAP